MKVRVMVVCALLVSGSAVGQAVRSKPAPAPADAASVDAIVAALYASVSHGPDTSADFDVYVLDAAGDVVGSEESTADPEKVTIKPTSGDYTVRVVPYAATGQTYHASASLAATGTGG